MKRWLFPAALAAALALPAAAGAATATFHGDGYTVVYDTGTSFGSFRSASSGADRRFGWDSSGVTDATATRVDPDTPFDLRTYALPALTVTADPGRLLSGLSLSLHGYVHDPIGRRVSWDAFLFDYRFSVGGAARSLAASLTPAPGEVATYRTRWTLTERYLGPPGFASFGFGGDAALTLGFAGDGPAAVAYNLIGEDADAYYTLQFDFRVDPLVLTTGVPTGATAPVPEPETWAMLLAGLGLVGAAARRRRLSSRGG